MLNIYGRCTWKSDGIDGSKQHNITQGRREADSIRETCKREGGREEEAHSPPGCQHPLESMQRPGHARARLCSRRASLPMQNFIVFYRISKEAALQMDK